MWRYGLLLGGLVWLGATAFATDLEGTWATRCHTTDKKIFKDSYVFDSGRVTGRSLRYLNADCDGLLAEIVFTGSYRLAGSSGGVDRIDIIAGRATITPSSSMAAYALNAMKMCGHEDWVQDTAKQVNGDDCGDEGKVPRVGSGVYDIIKVYSNDTMLIGKITPTEDRTSPARRPRALDRDVVFYLE